MVNVNKLRGKIVECGMNIESLAEKTGMSRDTLYRRISKGGIDFTINEADRIAKALSLTATELNEIFLRSMSRKMRNTKIRAERNGSFIDGSILKLSFFQIFRDTSLVFLCGV